MDQKMQKNCCLRVPS